MQIDKVDKSIINTKIILSLLDGKIKSANKISTEYESSYNENAYRIKCNYLADNGMLNKHLIKNRKGHAYSLNFDSFIKQLDPSIQIYGKEYLLKKFKEKPILDFISFLHKDVKLKTGDYSLFILHINLYLSNTLLLDTAMKIIGIHSNIDKKTKTILRRMKEFLDKKMSSPK